MTKRKPLLAGVVGGLATLMLAAGLVQANHVRIDVAPPMPQPPAVTAPQTLHVEEIKANQVRAQTIYANRIDADQVQGMVYQTKGVDIRAEGEIKAPEVSASVIYADKISANSVVADAVYVHKLRLK